MADTPSLRKSSIDLTGVEEVRRACERLVAALPWDRVADVLVEEGQPIAADMQQRAPISPFAADSGPGAFFKWRRKRRGTEGHQPGQLRRAIKVWKDKRARVIRIGARYNGSWKGNAAHLIEYGTKPHEIRGLGKGIGGIRRIRWRIQHPGIEARPFIRPAWDSGRDAYVDRVATRLRELAEQAVK